MKLLIASDLHGSSSCIKKLLERIEAEKPDKILFLGDILYHGPRNNLPNEYDTKKSIELLNSIADRIICVKGNCDSEVDQMVLNFNMDIEHIILEIDGLSIFASHGHHYNTGHLPSVSSFDILLHGHTHIPAFEKIDDKKYYVNPGSVSIPKGGSINSYLVLENRTFTWKDLDGKVFREEKI